MVAGEKASSTLRRILIAALVWVLAMLVGGTAWVVMRSRKRGMAGDDNEDDVEYSRLVTKGSRTGD